jgi:DNA-binding MarR family transcriptional regulator
MPDTSSTPAIDRRELVYQAVAALATGTAGEIAAQAAIPYPTVTPKLRALLDEGRVESYRDGEGRTRWRPTSAADTPDTDGVRAADTTMDFEPDTNHDDHAGSGAPTGPDREDAPSDPEPAPADQPTPAAADDSVPAATVRRRSGAVPEAILAAFADAEPGTEYKVTQLHHRTGISQGAIAVALAALVNKGKVIQTVERPATYRAVLPQQ